MAPIATDASSVVLYFVFALAYALISTLPPGFWVPDGVVLRSLCLAQKLHVPFQFR